MIADVIEQLIGGVCTLYQVTIDISDSDLKTALEWSDGRNLTKIQNLPQYIKRKGILIEPIIEDLQRGSQ